MRSFSLVLLRRLLFRASPPPTSKSPRLTLYDRLSAQTLTSIERILLHSLLHEQTDTVRRKAVDTISDLANNSMERGRPWHALQAQAFAMCKSADSSARESAFRIFAGCPNLVMDLQTDAVLRVLQDGLQDRQSIEVGPLLPLLIPHRSIQRFSLGPARSSSRFRVLPHLLRSTPSSAVLVTHVPHVGHPSLPLPRPPASVSDYPYPSNELPPAALRSTPSCLAFFPTCLDHTIG
jgi:hypothetical protein